MASDAQGTPLPTVLFVDDEANILSALRRLFRPEGYRLLFAGSGREALETLAGEPVDVVVSDMRMPEMDGAALLAAVRARWPETIRMLLTGYADVASTVAAINEGQVYRYVAKPWDDGEMRQTVRQAVELRALAREKQRLEALTRTQNEQLRELNASLETKVAERTADLRRALLSLTDANDKLKQNFVTSVRVFANLLEMRSPAVAGHARRVADGARAVARHLGMDDAGVQDVFLAALLHDIGKIALPDRLLEKPYSALEKDEVRAVMQHAVIGAAALMSLPQLGNAAAIVRAHHERFDGSGYPDGQVGLAIPLGARIVAVADDYDAVQCGYATARRMSPAEAMEYVLSGRGSRYDPTVVDAFTAVGTRKAQEEGRPEISLRTAELKPGMLLAHDLVSRGGVLLLGHGHELDAALIEQIRAFERADGHALMVRIQNRGATP